MAENGRLKSRLARVEAELNRTRTPSDPSCIAILDSGNRIACLPGGQWVPWPANAPFPKCCKVYGFDPRETGG
jgi:hypothetical protein